MIEIVWIFRARPERRTDFLTHYSSNGSWAQLFRRAAGYLGTTLLPDAADPDRFLCIDRWRDLAAFDRFKSDFAAAYSALDKQCEQFTLEETRIGIFSE